MTLPKWAENLRGTREARAEEYAVSEWGEDKAVKYSNSEEWINSRSSYLAGSENEERLLRALEIALTELNFYGYKAIHNPTASKTEQYWNDVGIWDHGEKAREAIREIEELK